MQMVAQNFSVVFNQSFTVGECRTMVFSSGRKVSLVFSSPRSLIVCVQSATSHRPRLPTSCRQVGDNRFKMVGSQRLVAGRQRLVTNGWQSTCDGRRQWYDKHGPFANRLWPTSCRTGPTLIADQKYV